MMLSVLGKLTLDNVLRCARCAADRIYQWNGRHIPQTLCRFTKGTTPDDDVVCACIASAGNLRQKCAIKRILIQHQCCRIFVGAKASHIRRTLRV